MSGVLSPFLGQIPACKSRSRSVRKKIYKFMLSSHYVPLAKDSRKSLLDLLPGRPLPERLASALQGQGRFSLALLEGSAFAAGVGLEEMRRLAGEQEESVEGLRIQSTRFVCSTVKKRKPLGELHQYQSADKRQLFFSTAQQEQESPSPEEATPMVSFFNFNEEFELGRGEQESLLKDNASLFQLDHHVSMRSSSLFDEQPHNDLFPFL